MKTITLLFVASSLTIGGIVAVIKRKKEENAWDVTKNLAAASNAFGPKKIY